MRRPARGPLFIAALFLLPGLTGCLAPMSQREAQDYATRGLGRYCREHTCAQFHYVKAQRIKDRWLVDYDAPAGRYTVTVENGGSTDVSVWDKASGTGP